MARGHVRVRWEKSIINEQSSLAKVCLDDNSIKPIVSEIRGKSSVVLVNCS